LSHLFIFSIQFYMIQPFSVFISWKLQIVLIIFGNAIFVTDVPIQMDFSIQKIGFHGFIFMHGVSPIILGKSIFFVILLF